MGTEPDFHKHFTNSLESIHHYVRYTNSEISDKEYYIIEKDLIKFIKETQPDEYAKLFESYGSDTLSEILKAIKKETENYPLWMIIRNGLNVKGYHLHLYFSKPRSSESIANELYKNNKIVFISELQIKEEDRPDIVLFLNGLPVIVIELKHEKNQNLNDAVRQFNERDFTDKIFQLPFLYITSDTSEVKVATNPEREKNFRWFNSGLFNKPMNDNEYPVEYLYRNVLSKDCIIEAISFFLIYVPKKEESDSSLETPAYSIFPRFHQSRMVNSVSNDIVDYYIEKGNCGKKYLINHSAGSGKTLSISWLADRLNSLYKTGTNEKIIDIVIVMTDRRSLDKNVKDDLINFTHIKDKIKFAAKANDLLEYLKNKEQIIVTTQQKITWVIDKLKTDPALKTLRVAFLIDEAHRSQDGKAGTEIRNLFKKVDEPDIIENEIDEEEVLAEALKVNIPNLMIVAFTATPSSNTVKLFGKSFDTYTEAEAIQEEYILDVASSITSYKTSYHLSKKSGVAIKDKDFPVGILSKLMMNIAFQDKELIQYKSELMLRIFDENVKHLIDGKAKAMIVTSSRISGLYFYEILKEKLKEKRQVNPADYNYDVLYAFTSFMHPETKIEISEKSVNNLSENELIEDLFDTDKYRLLIVANKFQTGFDQPLLAGMFLDKPVSDRNAVQTVSRLNRCHENKDRVIVVDFTNNADKIIKAFQKYRQGTPFKPVEPEPDKIIALYEDIISFNVINQKHADEFCQYKADKDDARIMTLSNSIRKLFLEKIKNTEEQKNYVNMLKKYITLHTFMSNFYDFENLYNNFAAFSEFISVQLIKHGTESDLKKAISNLFLSKSTVSYVKETKMDRGKKTRTGGGGGSIGGISKVSIDDMLEKIKLKFPISEEEALIIKEVCEEKIQDDNIREVVTNHKNDEPYLNGTVKPDIKESIKNSYNLKGLWECITDKKYSDPGSIFDIMSFTVIQATLFTST